MPNVHPNDRANLQYAIDAASTSAAQGGIPIGAALVFDVAGENILLTAGHNRHLQTGAPAHHAETDAYLILERALSTLSGTASAHDHDDKDEAELRARLEHIIRSRGILPQDLYRHLTLYTTMSPCPNCAKQAIESQVPRVVIGDNKTYFGNEKMLVDAGLEAVTIQTDDCVRLINQFIDARPDIAQQIGVQKVQL
ncbi:cytosine deaminase [Actinomortierella ambigua]|nr:cytosine deaminase [Actinomortierella ambigua]